MKLFVTGATGFLGRELVRVCVAAGHSVRYLSRGAHLPLDGAEPVSVSLEDEAGLQDALRGTEALFHLAGKVSRAPEDGPEMHRLHVELTKRLLDAAVGAGVRRVVLASTSGTIAVSDSHGHLATEVDHPDFELIGRWPYYISKHFQEQELMRYQAAGRLEAVILHPSLLLGPGDLKGSSTDDVLDILNGRVMALTDKGTVAFVDVRDAAPAFERALTAEDGRHYLLNGANMSVARFAERVAVAGDKTPPRLKLPSKWALRGARLLDGLAHVMDVDAPLNPVSVEMAGYNWGCSSARAERELGFVARDPQVTLNDTVRDLEARGMYRRPRRG